MRAVDRILDRFVGGVLEKSELGREISERLRIKHSFQAVFGTPDGRKVLRHIIRHAHVSRSTYVKGDRDLMLIREGERRLALSILRYVCTDRDELQSAIEETQNDAS